jgi:putative heme-binding domain-containing protein
LSEPLLGRNARIESSLLAARNHSDASVRLQLALSLGCWSDPRAWRALAELAMAHHDDLYVRTAILSSLTEENVGFVFSQILNAAAEQEALTDLAVKFAEALAALGDAELVSDAFDRILADSQADSFGWRAIAVNAMLDALARRGGPAARRLPEDARAALGQLRERARQIIVDGDAGEAQQVLALSLTGRTGLAHAEDLELIRNLLSPNCPPSVQIAAVDALVNLADEQAPQLLLEDWASYSPQVHGRILDQLLGRITWTDELLEAIAEGTVPAAHIDARRRQLLLDHDDQQIRETASRLLQGAGPSTRAEVLAQFQDVLEMPSDPVQGKAVFADKCATCHQLEGVGQSVGMNLDNLTNRSPQALLIAIIDPNQAVGDRFLDYRVLLTNGRQRSGMIARESSNSIVLVDQEGQEAEILRSQIDEMLTAGKSLMPEGLERDLSRQQLADVIAYVASIHPEPKQFRGNRPAVVRPGDDKSLQLLARHARIYGPSVVFDHERDIATQWLSPDDQLRWSLDGQPAGTYDVVIDYACDEQSAGDTVLFQVAGQIVGGRVLSTSGWDKYDTLSLGTVTLPPGPIEASMGSEGLIRNALLDLRVVRLIPVTP